MMYVGYSMNLVVRATLFESDAGCAVSAGISAELEEQTKQKLAHFARDLQLRYPFQIDHSSKDCCRWRIWPSRLSPSLPGVDMDGWRDFLPSQTCDKCIRRSSSLNYSFVHRIHLANMQVFNFPSAVFAIWTRGLNWLGIVVLICVRNIKENLGKTSTTKHSTSSAFLMLKHRKCAAIYHNRGSQLQHSQIYLSVCFAQKKSPSLEGQEH